MADAYRTHNMPGGWILPNDGYGCGYGEGPAQFPLNFTDLDFVVAELHKRGFYTGLWSSTGLRTLFCPLAALRRCSCRPIATPEAFICSGPLIVIGIGVPPMVV